jgi:hypothetical protein
MPTGLRWIAIAASFLSLCMLSVFPIGHLRKDGFELSYADAWTEWVIPTLFSIGAYSAITAYGIYRAKGWSRLLAIGGVVIAQHAGHDQWKFRILVPLILTLYLYRSGNVRTYFTCQEQPLEPKVTRSLFWRPKRRFFPNL